MRKVKEIIYKFGEVFYVEATIYQFHEMPKEIQNKIIENAIEDRKYELKQSENLRCDDYQEYEEPEYDLTNIENAIKEAEKVNLPFLWRWIYWDKHNGLMEVMKEVLNSWYYADGKKYLGG
jgi:Tfp pilus assembly pilus retraction ATPase PilT